MAKLAISSHQLIVCLFYDCYVCVLRSMLTFTELDPKPNLIEFNVHSVHSATLKLDETEQVLGLGCFISVYVNTLIVWLSM